MTTPFEDAFERAGFGRDAVLFLTAYARLLNNGGSRQQADDLLDYADRHNLPGRGHSSHAEGHSSPAPSRHPNGEDGGQSSHADEGLVKSAPASPPSGDGEGRLAFAHRGQSANAPSSPPHGGEGGQWLYADKGPISPSSPPSQDAGHRRPADKARDEMPAGAGAGQCTGADKAICGMPAPRPMSESRRSAMMKVGQKRAQTFWDIELGGTRKKIGKLTYLDVCNGKRRSAIDNHIYSRLEREISWPDRTSKAVDELKDIADMDKVKAIVQSAYTALEASNA